MLRPFFISLALGGLLAGNLQGGAPLSPARRPSRAERVAQYFHRPVEEVTGLRHQGFGYGEIVKILVIAEASKRPVAELLGRNHEGYGWGTISRDLGLNPVEVKKRVDQARKDLKIRIRPWKRR